MKHTIILLLIPFFLLGYRSTAQVRDTFDYRHLPSEVEFPVTYKKPFQIVILNLNKKTYKVEDGKTDVNFNIATPDVLSGIKAPSFLFLSPLPATASVPQSPRVSKALHDAKTHPETSIPEAFAEIDRRVDKLNQSVVLYNDLNQAARSCSDTTELILAKVDQMTNDYVFDKQGKPMPRAQLYQHFKDTLLGLRKGAEEQLAALEELVPAYIGTHTKQLDDALEVDQDNITLLKNELGKSKLSKSERSDMQQRLDEQQKGLSLDTKKKDDFKKTADEITANLKEAQDAVEGMFEFDKDNKLYTILNIYSVLSNPATYTYTSDVIIPKKDETTFTLTITPQDLTDCPIPDKKSATFTLKATGGLKIDFSTGLFVNGGNEDFLGRTFYYKNLTDSTRQIVSAKRGSRLMLSIGGLVHFYKRSPAFVKLGGSIGASTTADFDDLNFHIGPSLILGNKNRLILTGGLTLKSSKILDRQLQMNTTYSTKDSPDDIPTISSFPRAGWFVGLTYNLNLDL